MKAETDDDMGSFGGETGPVYHQRAAEQMLAHAAELASSGQWAACSGRCREAAIAAVTAILGLTDLAVPPVTMLATFLDLEKARLPAPVRPDLDRLVRILRYGLRVDDLSLYNDLAYARDANDPKAAKESLEHARFVVELAAQALSAGGVR